MNCFQRLRRAWDVLFKEDNKNRMVAEILGDQLTTDLFVKKVIEAIYNHPEEWTINDSGATHRSGVELATGGDGYNGRETTAYVATIKKPTYIHVEAEHKKKLGEAFERLAKLKILQEIGANE